MNAETATPRKDAAYSIFSASPAGKRALIRFVTDPCGRPRLATLAFDLVFMREV
jgi:hypothetical protein